ncbi:tellurite resistance TerB family protein [Loktanella sp. S4079]|uniref:tellurite resistance TerB family protein n=1 Tax=Loktanella sp. S4079 TaxID=579483 RepID=UPI000697319B|nr:TerB family tellurite resistance protein [Loktanella sp. S4079]
MKNIAAALFLLVSFGTSAQAADFGVARVDGLEFVAETRIPDPDDQFMSLCYLTEDLMIMGLRITSDITSYALSNDGCTETYEQLYSEDKIIAAQALNLIPAEVDPVARNDWERNLSVYGVIAAVCLALIAVIIRRMKSLLGYDPNGPMRKKAAQRILSAMCHMAKCDGIVDAKEIAHIRSTAKRLTGRDYPSSEVIQIADSIDMSHGLDENDFIAFGKGLRDREKDMMMEGVLTVALASNRMQPNEHAFASELAYGLGMPGEDFRRVLDLAFEATKP